MWVSLIKWHGDKLMCSPEDRSLCIPLRSLRMSRPPLRSCGRSFIQPSSQDLNINLPLSLSPRSTVVSGMQACVAPLLAARSRRRRRRKKKKKRSLCIPAAAPSSLIHIIFSCREAKGPESWKQPRDWKSAASFHLICLLVTSCVTFPCSH